jgi:hypothetical protein
MLECLQEDAELAGNVKIVDELKRLKDAKVDAIRTNHPKEVIDPAVALELQFLCGSQAPVVHNCYLQKRLLEQVQGKGVYTVVFGGLYYQFRGIKKAKDVLGAATPASDLDLFFESLGIGNIKGGENADQLFARLRSDRRLAMVRSRVTGKPRDVDWFNTPGAQANVNAAGFITGDLFDESIDIGQPAYANLEKPARDGREAIFPGLNKFPICILVDSKGALVDSAPDKLVSDTTIPDPHGKILQPARSCIICHGIFGDSGWRALRNDVQAMFNPRLSPRLDVFDDRGGGRARIITDVIQRLAGRYQGSPAKPLRRNREDLMEAYMEACGPWPQGGDQTGIVKLATLELQRQMDSYWYGTVDARQALREEGLAVPEEMDAVAVFAAVHPPDTRLTLDGIVPESAVVAALKAGLGVSRADFALQFSYLAERSAPFRRALLERQVRRGQPRSTTAS